MLLLLIKPVVTDIIYAETVHELVRTTWINVYANEPVHMWVYFDLYQWYIRKKKKLKTN